MSLTTGEMSAADLAAVVGNGNNGFGWGGEGGLLSILLILAIFGGGFGWGGGFGGGNLGGGMMFPWWAYLSNNTDNGVQRGFDTAAITGQLSGIQSSISNGFATAEVAGCNRAMDAMATAYNNQIASLNRSFDAQTAVDTRLDTLDMSLQNCCCENRLATSQTQNIVQAEAAANRYADAINTRDIINSQRDGTQAVLDKLCQLEIDGVRSDLEAERRQNATLQNQLNMAAFRADNVAQTAALVADNNAQSQLLIQRIAPYPIPAYAVANPYGCSGYGFNGGFGFGNGFGIG